MARRDSKSAARSGCATWAALDGEMARGGQCGGAVERGGGEINGYYGPALLG